MHPFPRRVRAEFAGRTVLDTRRGVLLHESAIPPQLYVPEEDLDTAAFEPTDHRTHCPFKGDATYRSLKVGDRVVDNALSAYPDPIPTAPWLAGYAALYWSAPDAWYDEDEPVLGRLTDPYHRVDVRQSSRHVQVFAGDIPVAGPARRWCCPRPACPTASTSHPTTSPRGRWSRPARTPFLPFKGEADYWSVRLPDGRELTDAAWGYPKPLPESSAIAGRISFLHDDLRTGRRRRAGLIAGDPRP